MDNLIKYMQGEYGHVNGTSLDELSDYLLNQVIPGLIGTTFQLNQYNNANFAAKNVFPNMKLIWGKTDNNTFILKGFEKI